MLNPKIKHMWNHDQEVTSQMPLIPIAFCPLLVFVVTDERFGPFSIISGHDINSCPLLQSRYIPLIYYY